MGGRRLLGRLAEKKNMCQVSCFALNHQVGKTPAAASSRASISNLWETQAELMS